MHMPISHDDRPPKTLEEYSERPAEFQDLWNRVTQVVSRVREGVSLAQASREFGLDPRVVIRLAGSALFKAKNGRYEARASDRLLRLLMTLTTEDRVELVFNDSQMSSIVGRHWAAVQRYLRTGDSSALQDFQGQSVTDASGNKWQLLTDLDELDRLGSAGVLSFESIYARIA